MSTPTCKKKSRISCNLLAHYLRVGRDIVVLGREVVVRFVGGLGRDFDVVVLGREVVVRFVGGLGRVFDIDGLDREVVARFVGGLGRVFDIDGLERGFDIDGLDREVVARFVGGLGRDFDVDGLERGLDIDGFLREVVAGFVLGLLDITGLIGLCFPITGGLLFDERVRFPASVTGFFRDVVPALYLCLRLALEGLLHLKPCALPSFPNLTLPFL